MPLTPTSTLPRDQVMDFQIGRMSQLSPINAINAISIRTQPCVPCALPKDTRQGAPPNAPCHQCMHQWSVFSTVTLRHTPPPILKNPPSYQKAHRRWESYQSHPAGQHSHQFRMECLLIGLLLVTGWNFDHGCLHINKFWASHVFLFWRRGTNKKNPTKRKVAHSPFSFA